MKVNKLLSDLGTVKLVAVTKKVAVEKINQAISEGATDIGESRIDEFSDKAPHLLPCKKHMIGHLQSNKVALAVELFDMIQSVDSIKILEAINRHADRINKKQDILIQVNIGREKQKVGILDEELESFLEKTTSYQNVSVKGLMCIPPKENPTENFRKMRVLFDRYKDKYHLDTLSMGMSDDYKIAIKEGATMVRIGSEIFKENPKV